MKQPMYFSKLIRSLLCCIGWPDEELLGLIELNLRVEVNKNMFIPTTLHAHSY